ncbi:MAG: hypothetical protein LUD00_05980 [Prevotellaceae bacterium]|nr:hypothetical protein [Prevotellaceae bacterium]
MKHKLLLFGASMLVGSTAFAQWTKPADPAAVEPELEEVYYLYNKDAGAFFAGMGQWGTRAGVSTSKGEKVRLRQAINANYGEIDAEEWDGVTYIFQDSVEVKKRFDEVWFGTDSATIWVDRQNDVNGNLNFSWNFVKQDNGMYRIKASDTVDDYQADKVDGWLGLVASKADNSCYFCTESRFPGETLQVDWYFVTPDAYEAYIPALEIYGAAMTLKTAIDKAKADCPGIVLTDAEAVYNNTASTAEELTEAVKLVEAATIEYAKNNASVDKPADMTAAITNATFDSDSSGWEGDAPTQGSGAGEYFNKNFDGHQTIKNLKPGIYKVGVQAFYRAGGHGGDPEYNSYTEDPTKDRNAVLYATTSLNEMSNTIKRAMDEAVSESLGGDESAVGDKFIPNNMATAVTYFEHDLYHNSVYACVGEDGELTIGIKKSTTIDNDWVLLDNWTLLYYGDSDAAYTLWKEEAVKTLPTIELGEEDLYKVSYKEDYDKAVAAVGTATSKEDILTAIPAVTKAVSALQANVDAYAAYAAAVEEADLYFQEHTDLMGSEVDFVTWYLMSEEGPDEDYVNGGAQYILANLQLTTEEIVAETEKLKEWKDLAIKNGVSEGSDMTSVVINPGFELPDGEGWTGNITNAHGGNANNYCAEAFNMFFDFYQDVSGLPNGLYKVSVQAFYRAAANDIAWAGKDSDPVLSEVYFNDFATPVKNVMSIEYSENLADNCWSTPNGTYTLDGMNSASAAFSLEDENMNFTQNVYGIVTDGTMRLGIRQKENAAAQDSRWTLWDNFKITYMGKNEEALTEVINSLTETATALLSEDMFAADLDALQTAMANAADAQGGDAMYDAVIALNAGINTAKASAQAYVALNDALNDLSDAMGIYEGTASDEALSKAGDLADEINANMENYTGADAEGKIAEIKDAIARLRVPDGSEASDENPIDFTQVIENPAFDDGNANGWDYSSFTQGNRGYQNNNVYTNPESEATCNQFIEAWRSGNAALEDAEIIQKLAYLPAGGYALEVDAIACNQGDVNTPVEGVFLFAQEGENAAYKENLHTVGSAPEHFVLYFTKQEADSEVTIGIRTEETGANWFVADNFKLTYYGTDSQVSIDGVTPSGAEVVAVEYYTLGGVRVATPQKGVNILKATLSDGTVKVSKVIF